MERIGFWKKKLWLLGIILSITHLSFGQIIFADACFPGGGTMTLTQSGTTSDGQIRNTFIGESDYGEMVKIIWQNNQWEILADYGFGYELFHTKTVASYPNPPALSLGSWSNISGCGPISTFTGDVQSTIVPNSAPTFTSTAITEQGDNSTYNYYVATSDINDDDVSVAATTKPSWLAMETITRYIKIGAGTAGDTDGAADVATFDGPSDVAVDASGNIYVAESNNNRIRKITPEGVVSTFAGSGDAATTDGTGTAAAFNHPVGIATDASGNVYVTEDPGNAVRKITPAGEVTTIATALLRLSAVVVDSDDNVYVGGWFSTYKVYKITPAMVRTEVAFGFGEISALDIDADDNLYLADKSSNIIYKIDNTGFRTTVMSGVSNMTGMARDADGNFYVVKNGTQIDKIAPGGSTVTKIVNLSSANGIVLDASDRLCIAAQGGHQVQTYQEGVYTLSGNPAGQVGTHDVVLTANDGNGGIATQSFTITVSDATAPEGYFVNTSDMAIKYGNKIAFSFPISFAEVGATYNYTFSAGDTDVTGSGTITSSSQNISGIDLSDLADGTVTFSITLTDAHGNVGSAVGGTLTKDTIVPVVTVDALVTSDQTPKLTGTVDDVTSYLTGFLSNSQSLTITNNGDGTWEVADNTITALEEGVYGVTIYANDNVMNTGVDATSNELTIDLTAPTGYTASIDQTYINSSNVDALSFTFSGAEVGATYDYTLSSSGGGSEVTGSGTISTTTDQISDIDVSGLAEGIITLSVTLTDVANNVGQATASIKTKDTTAPVVTVDVLVTNNQSPKITGVVDDASATMLGIISDGQTPTVINNGDGTWEIAAGVLSSLAEGTYSLFITATDAAGNQTTNSSEYDLEIDLTAPSGYTVSIDQAEVNSENEGALSFTFTDAEVGATYDYTLSSTGGGADVTGSGTISAATDQVSGIDASGLGDGTITLSVTLTDEATNTGSAAEDTKAKDATSPVFASGTTASFTENGTGTVYTATATDAGSITYSLGTANDESLFTIEESTGVVTFKVSPDFENPIDADGDNVYEIIVVASDGANEVNLEVAITVEDEEDGETTVTSIDDGLEHYISIFPNPASQVLNFDLSKMNESVGSLSVINNAGVQIMELELGGVKSLTIPVNSYPSGLYHVVFKTGTSTISKRLIIK
ncbi:Ig-like domain-containing protein [Reichenbachiella carrageenanivorans]|uniref:Ig-like domain-containing protein n=2 Tax=Reichenbachiella carrageenanivorans TaxID=2979869 RepID=A0ABY6D025_9BACT|nr:Ig-like domain-containing protein [Reichenbachiella carrageenanivorans]UXX79532.1 Ig-like domain-containing protein [Reichenbachiella carrageenanivorans]